MVFWPPYRDWIVSTYKWIQAPESSVMNWFIQPTEDIYDFNFQLPQPQHFLISSNISPQDSIHSIREMEFEAADFMSCCDSRREEEIQSILLPTPPVAVEKKRIRPRYQKNLCGYIVKKALRAFVSESYRNVALLACSKHEASFEEVQKLCMSRMESVYGPSHLKLLLVPETKEQISVKNTITQFLEWFLAERYIRHLILEGKMENQQKYILYKNKFFPKEIAKFKRMTQQFISSQ